jgi:hypothetical protein
MQYALLIYEPEAGRSDAPEVLKAHAAGVADFVAEYADRITGGVPLKPIEDATTIRIRGDETLTTDGPFAETKEILAGFFLLELDNLDDALAAAAKLPLVRTGAVEVRPVAEMLQTMVNEAAENPK